jgi:hypothetical protein
MIQHINYPYGYYQVGADVYLNKLEAIYNAQTRHQPITWHFHDDVFAKIDWTIRPSGTLRDLYRDRARQIRDNYDYVVVHFSGGMDSWTVLHSFLSNGIHLDEVRTRWPFAERKYRPADPLNLNADNLTSEFEYAVLPVLEDIKKTHPKTNISILDYSDSFNIDALLEKDIAKMNKYQHMSTMFKFAKQSDNETLAESLGETVAHVIGIEKINCYKTTDAVTGKSKFNACFRDMFNLDSMPEHKQVELFYWSRDFPTIPILQAHCIKDLVKLRPDLEVWDNPGLSNVSHIEKYNKFRMLYQMACYPDYDLGTFQVQKQAGTIITENESWIQQYNPRFVESWNWALKQYITEKTSSFLDKRLGKIGGLTFIPSQYYLVE